LPHAEPARGAQVGSAPHNNETLVALLLWSTLVQGVAERASLGAAALSALVFLPLLARRRAPLLVLLVVCAVASVGYASVDDTQGDLQVWIAFNVALYSAAAHLPLGPAVAAAGLVATLTFAVEISRLGDTKAEDVAGELLFLAFVWALGRWVRRRRQRTEHLEERTVWLEADRDERARAAVAEERARIAREMHDAVAHTVSVMVLQAGAAEETLAVAPERAREALVTIQDAGREAIVELHRMLGVLREPVADLALAPNPGVARLDALLDHVRRAGLPVELSVEGEPRRLPAGLDRSVYRIVQEGLTNTLKHAGPAHATVRLSYGGREIELEVLDDGTGPAAGNGGGFGLVGMRERAELYGGVLESGARPGGGHALRARLPFGGAPS
jgi:signal transduction histidine kinase